MTQEKKSHKRFIVPSEQDIYEALLWLKDEMHIVDMTGAKGKWGSSVYSRIARSIRHAYRTKRLEIKAPNYKTK